MNGPYLIKSAPNYRRYLAAKVVREATEILFLPVTIATCASSGYLSELDHMLSAPLVGQASDSMNPAPIFERSGNVLWSTRVRLAKRVHA